MNIFEQISNFLLDEKRRLSSKATLVFFIIVSLLLLDNYFSFSFNYTTNHQIEQIEKLNSIINNTANDNTTKSFAIKIRNEIIQKDNIITKSYYYLKTFKWTEHESIEKNKNELSEDIPVKKNLFWFYLSAGGTYYLAAIIMFIGMLFTDKHTSIFQRLATGTVVAIIMFGIGAFFNWLFGLIPQISNTTWGWNYALNYILQIALLGFIVLISKNKKSKEYVK